MPQSNSNYLFAMMNDVHVELFRLGKIEASEVEFLNASSHKLHRLFRNLITALTKLDTAESIDFEYYMKLSYVSNSELKKSEIEQDDPFYPIYKHSESLLEILNYLKEFYVSEGNNALPKDYLVKSILSSKKTFMDDLNSSLCKQYTLKTINDPYKRILLEPVTKNKINKIYLKYINTQQEILKVFLTTDQTQLPEFIEESAAYDLFITSYNEFYKDENSKEINQNFTTVNHDDNGISHEGLDIIKVKNYSNPNNTITDGSITVFPNALKPESLTLEQDFPFKIISYKDPRTFLLAESNSRVSRTYSNDLSSNSVGLYGQLSLIIFILMLLGFYRKVY